MKRFKYGPEEFGIIRNAIRNQLVPNWRRFLEELLSEKAGERCVRLLPVALAILQEYGRKNPTAATG